jgi:F-type H+-transporting ATPase subunit b
MIADFIFEHISDFFWGLGAFVLFVLILYRMAAKHVLAAVQAREEKIARELRESEDAYTKAKQVQAELEAKFRAAEGRISELMSEARRNADQLKTEAVEKGREEIEALRVRSLRDIEAARHAAIVDLRAEVAELAAMVAEKILREKVDARQQEQFTAQAIDAFEARRAGIGAGSAARGSH